MTTTAPPCTDLRDVAKEPALLTPGELSIDDLKELYSQGYIGRKRYNILVGYELHGGEVARASCGHIVRERNVIVGGSADWGYAYADDGETAGEHSCSECYKKIERAASKVQD